MHKLMLDHRRGLLVENTPILDLMKGSTKSFIGTSLLGEAIVGLAAEGDEVHWVLLYVVYHLSVGVGDHGPDLQVLKLVKRLGSATMRRGILGGGPLLERAGSCPLSKLLRVSGGSPARARATDVLALL
jgi:hypothetical protein